VVYLIFNEGYAASEGERLSRTDLAEEAIRLGRVLADLMPDEPEVLGLLALMLLHHARRRARTDADGELVTLEAQDRSLWDGASIEEGQRLLDQAMVMRRPGGYQVQAAIAALHDEAENADATDWPQIAALYATLERLQASSVVALNRAVAVAMAEGIAAGLRRLDALAGELDGYHLRHAARADLLRRAERYTDAAAAYRGAIERCTNMIERRYLERRVVEVSAFNG
jgi:RNA polymerase sigma-70 factor (ECF subfamily)